MKTPKGFGKNYFSLSAICAYSNGVVLQAQVSSYTHLSRNLSFETLEEEEPLEELELLLLENTNTKALASDFYLNTIIKLISSHLFLNPFHFLLTTKNPLGTSPP
ncbi:MAG TPA: hypothetical protein EYO73_03335 [Sulfurimonas sp.]|nr:hypothetical protein [Sulfurimonas sp.]